MQTRPITSVLPVAGLASLAIVGGSAGGSADDPGGPEADLASGASGFVPIPPYRMYDSRNDPLGIWLLGDDFYIDAITDENLHPRIPETATAVTFNVAVTQTGRKGWVQVYGPGAAPLSTSAVNWVTPNTDVANSGSTQLTGFIGIPGYMRVALGGIPRAAAHIVIDITGYYELLEPIDDSGAQG